MVEALRSQHHTVTSSIGRGNAPVACEAVRFYGRELHIALVKAAEYLRDWESAQGYPPSVVALHDEFSWEDSGDEIAWQLTLILRESTEPAW